MSIISRQIFGTFISVIATCGSLFAQADAEKAPTPFFEGERAHWAYQPLERPDLPAVANDRWPKNDIDTFVLARLETAELAPSTVASRRMLIRRATLDVWGIPPTPDQVEKFLADTKPGAFERVVDRLLASPYYGERWARHWLDLVRYAESDGYKSDGVREGAWRYRDYVIRAFNEDKPYDRFMAEQIAGDELWPTRRDAVVATGFMRHWPYEDNGRDLDQQWTDILNSVTNVSGQVFLGMTVRCARCHDHKFDAIKQTDYFRLQAFFAAMTPRNDLPVANDDQLAAYHERLQKWETATAKLRAERTQLESPFLQKAERSMGNQFPPHIQEILEILPERRTPYQQQLVILGGKMLRVDRKKMAEKMKGDVKNRWDELSKQIDEFKDIKPDKHAFARGVRDIGKTAPPTTVPGKAKEVIAPGFLSILHPAPAKIRPAPAAQNSTGRRSTLAEWLGKSSNPLPARVMVNRLWQHHFGRGIVATPGDFGVMGDRPTHPKLLDYLASEFIASDWKLKHLHRLMLTSATYRQSSVADGSNVGLKKDPNNNLLWKMRPRRIEAEVLRDSILATTGQLNNKMFGPSVSPELPKGLSERYGWKPTKPASEQRRRSIYLIVKRNTHLPLLKTFDVPDNHDTCMRRDRTTTPTQALILLNDSWPLERSRELAARLLRECSKDNREWINRAYMICFSRPPTPAETEAGLNFLLGQAKLASKPTMLPTNVPDDVTPSQAAALVDYCHALWNTNEFMYVD